MNITIFANYGVLAHEKQIVYTVGNPQGTATCYEELQVVIPDKYEPYETVTDDIGVVIDGGLYLFREVLTTDKDNGPCMSWYDGKRNQYVKLQFAK